MGVGGGGGGTSNNAKSAACQGQAVFQSAGKTRRGLGSVVTHSAPCLPCQSARGSLRKLSVSLSLTFPVLQLCLLTPRVSLGVGGGGGGGVACVSWSLGSLSVVSKTDLVD